MSPLLQKKLDNLSKKEINKSEIDEQRIIFAFGNTPEGCEDMNIKTVRKTAKKIYNT